MLCRASLPSLPRGIFAIVTAVVILGVTQDRTGSAQTSPVITSITVVKRPGRSDGRAMATVKGKAGSITAHALQAWRVLDGQGALLLLSPRKKGQQYPLRYYQVDAGKGRLLGFVPFPEATMVESNIKGNPWAFAVSGVDPAVGQPATFVGDTQTIHAKLANAANPKFLGDSLSYVVAGARTITRTALLLGLETEGRIYAIRESTPPSYWQFLPSGESLTGKTDGPVEHGHWITDGLQFRVTTTQGTVTAWRLSDLVPVAGIPATSRLNVRLLQPLSSRTARKGMDVHAVSISPGLFEETILIPQGSEFHGAIVDAHGVGLGIKHESAALTVHFDSVRLPDGRTLPIDARVYKVENAREDVTKAGKVQGIRSTGTLGHSAENQIASLAQIDPVLYLFTGSAGPAVLGFAEPEILYNAGTEMDIEFNKPVLTSQTYAPQVPGMDRPPNQDTQFDVMVKDLPFRTRTEGSHKESDITNLIFIGRPESLRRAFQAAGWTVADSLTSAAAFQTVKTLSGNQTYTQAPMSMLVLGDEKPLFTLQKTTNTFSSRHHLRLFQTTQHWGGEQVLTASSTQDTGIAFSYKQKTFIHVIDQYLDNERSKVSNDLEFTGCVDSIDLVARPWVPQDAYNSTGDRLLTDGKAAVMRINECAAPRVTPSTVASRAPLLERSERNTALTIKDTLYRGNLIYTGIVGGIKIHRYLANQGELGEAAGNWRKSDASGTQYRLAGTAPPLLRRRGPWNSDTYQKGQSQLDSDALDQIAAHKWDPSHFEIGLNLGYSNYRNHILEVTLVNLVSSTPDLNHPEYFLGLVDGVFDGWAAGLSLTLNTWNWVSNEFSYTRQQTKFELIALTISSAEGQNSAVDARIVGLVTRRFAYNTVFNLRPKRSRWRPYITAGPAFQLLSLSNAPLKKPSGYFRLGLSNIGLVKAAFDFGSVAPLDGGGIFQFGLQYGAGIKYRVTPHLMMRGDFGETLSANPKIIRDSYLGYEPIGLDDTYSTQVTYQKPAARYLQQRATVGFAFTF